LQSYHAFLSPRRIARSLVTVLGLSLIQTVLPPVLAPIVSVPKAEAVDVSYASAPNGTDIVVPAGVFSITLTARGAAGGTGGNDGSAVGIAGTTVGYVAGTFPVTPGDRISFYPGGAGGNGASGVQGNGGGSKGLTSMAIGANTFSSAVKFNGVWTTAALVGGGLGGPAGGTGFSGAGGGGGAASVVLINSDVAIVAGGGGGGAGGSGGGTSAAVSGTHSSNGVANGADGVYNNGCGNGDGGGPGGGGGGWFGGTAGGLDRPSSGECRAYSGSPGQNHASSTGTITASNLTTAANGAGFITYEFNYSAVTACATTSNTVDVYTVIRVTTTATCTWNVPASVSVIDLFLVGGGGGGAGDSGGGGGGGAALSRSSIAVTPSSTLNLKVGYGGGAGSFGFRSTAFAGDSTTVRTSAGVVFSALGGSASSAVPGAAGGLGGVAGNGGFSGGAGGAGATCFNVGLTGRTGISNYFYGSLNTYSGGGGGGSCPNGAATTAPTGVNGGGNGGFASSASVNQPGSDATANTGGGGGGGIATGSGMKLPGGKGGSGVILIRYATNSADAFPATLASAVAGRYSPGDLQLLDSSRKGWIDSSGTNASVADANITATGLSILNQGVTDGGVTTGSTKSLLAVRGSPSSQITLQNLNVGYTLFHVARYVASGANERIFTARDANWLSGFHYGVRETHHGAWLTDDARVVNTQWLLSTDQAVAYRANGIDVADNDDSIGTQLTSVANFGINNWTSVQRSDFQVSDVIIFNRELSVGEIRLMEIYLSRLNGLTLSPYFNTSETDTTNTITASYSYQFMQQDARNNLNDTFTVEAWLRPDATCNTTVCTYFAREGSVRLVVRNGLYEFILHGDAGWEWVPTGVPIKSGEWQHVAISKTLRGNRGDSVKLYINGQLAYTKAGSPYRTATTASTNSDASTLTQVTTWSYIGVISNGGERWRGDIDEFKIWKVARTQSEIQADMHSNDASSPLMQAYFDMNFVPGTRNNEFKIPNLAYGGHARSDLFNWTADTLTFTDIKTVTTSGPYTTITFPRTYITQFGGWKPSSTLSATTIVVGGGGGAGKSDSRNSAPAGAGGGGGVTYAPVQSFTASSPIPVRVGVGGLGATSKADDASNRNGGSSYVGVGAGITALGGGGGGSNNNPGAGGSTVATGGGGGGNPFSGSCSVQGPSGGTVPSGYNGATGGWGWGGLGGSARGAATTSGCYGIAGDGFIDPITNIEYGHTGSNRYHSTWSVDSNYTTANNGWGGSVSYGGSAIATGAGISGSAGVVVIRYITAALPAYTKPANIFLNVGMTETFTTNVAQDSATAVLTRTFRWESTTAGANGPFITIKEGTGANNAFFAWVPTDTSTSGSQYLYRLTVTDSDTAGLFISDSSTAFAVINRTLAMTGKSSISKSIGVSKSETFNVDGGTSTFRYTLSPDSAFFWLDTVTATSPRLRIADTATVGTYLETITVTDSVSASVTIPLTIKVSPPPSFSASAEQIDSGTVLYLDAGNSASYPRTGTSWSDLSGRGLSGNLTASLGSRLASSSTNTCVAPNFSTEGNGAFNFISASRTCAYVADLGTLTSYTVDTWIKRSGAQAANSAIFTTPYSGSGKQINISLHWSSSTQIVAGIFTGSNPWIYSAAVTIDDNTWTNLVVTFSGNVLTLIKNNVSTTPTTGISVAWNPANTDTGLLVGRRWDGDSDWFTGSVASLRIYNRVLTTAELTQNYNATRGRFDGTSNKIRVAGKYGTTVNETFTVTAGSETLTASFTENAIAGLRWDTSTVRSLKIQIQESLLPNTYTDTVTVTDIYGVSSRIPLTFVVSKADTITVTAGPATTQVFNNQQATSLPNFGISGLVLSDSGSVVRRYTGIDWTKPCAQGGGCEVGDSGPGGGTIFYISPTAINAATGISSGGRYLEVAPINWSGLSVESTTAWARVQTSVTGTSSAIGSGAENTRLINSALGTNALAAKIAADLTYGGRSDWFLPSTLEVKEMYDALYAPNLAGNLSIRNYWSSTQGTNTAQADTYWFGDGGLVSTTDKLNPFTVRPIRAYSPDTITVTTVPTNVDSYTVSVDTVTLTSGSLSNYEGVIYQRSGLDITQARQDSLRVNTFGATLGQPFRITILGGSGSGAVTETLVSGSTATGCAISGDTITSTTAGTCNIQIKKAYSRNYLTETATATVYFLLWVINQPSPGPGSGPNIALTGENDVTVDVDLAPMISSLSLYEATAGVTSITIYGVGFNNSDASFEVKFWRGVNGTGFTVNPAKTEITVTVPAGTRTGKVIVVTSKGLAQSELPLVIAP
jgi:hypothetical protein